MTINPNNTTTGCSGSAIALADECARLLNVGAHGNVGAAFDLLVRCEAVLRTQASAPRSASAGDGQEDRLRDRKNRLENSFGGGDFHDGMARKAIAEIDAELAALAAPPPIRIDQDVGIKALEKIDALISNGDRPTVNEQNAFEHFGKLNRLLLSIRDIARAAISVNTTAGATTRTSIIQECANVVGEMRQSEAGIFDAAHSGQRGEDRSNALYDAYQAIRALASNPLEGKVAK